MGGHGASCIKDCRQLADAIRELVRKEVRTVAGLLIVAASLSLEGSDVHKSARN